MKRSGCAALGCAGALVAVLAGLAGLAVCPDGFGCDAYQQSDPLNQFARAEAGGRLRLSYGFVDYHGRRQQVSCTIDKQDMTVTSPPSATSRTR